MSTAASEITDNASDRIEVISTSHDISNQSHEHLRQRSTIEPFETEDEAHNSPESEPDYPTGAKFYTICFSVALVLILSGLDGNIVATAVPTITDHFHTVADVGWYYSAFKLTGCASQFMYGKLYKIFPIKTVLLTCIVIFLVGSVLCTAAATSKMFVLGRAVTGLGSGGIISGCFNLLVVLCPLRRRPLVTGVLGAVECVAVVIAPLLGKIELCTLNLTHV